MHLFSTRSVLHSDLATIMQSDVERIPIEAYRAWIGFYRPARWSSDRYTWISAEFTGEDAEDNACGFVQSNLEWWVTVLSRETWIHPCWGLSTN